MSSASLTTAQPTWYSSMEVNSGLCREEVPSLRKMRPNLKDPLKAAHQHALEVQLPAGWQHDL